MSCPPSVLLYLSQLPFEKLLFAVDGDYHRKPQLAKVQKNRDYGMLTPKGNTYLPPSTLRHDREKRVGSGRARAG